MKITDRYIVLNQVHFYAYHGVGEQETKVGNDYVIDLRIKTDFSEAALTDQVSDTINYAEIYEVLKQQMEIPSKLLEHVSYRIMNQLFETFPTIEEVELKLYKRNPPMGADIASSCVELKGIKE
ncbi:MAG: dihydroneopterin aldolase [Bacteroides sp.]